MSSTGYAYATQPTVNPKNILGQAKQAADPVPKRFRGYGLLEGPSPNKMDEPEAHISCAVMSWGPWGYKVCPEFIFCKRNRHTFCDYAKPLTRQEQVVHCPVKEHTDSFAAGEDRPGYIDLIEVDKDED